MSMDKAFDPRAVETRWRQRWEDSGHFAPSGEGESYAMMIPPPNVTGTLHMGHAFQHTVMDALIRHQRMLGKDTLWLPGTDHAGIATQMVVERQLAASNETRLGLGRDAFLERVWKWKEQSGGTITRQIRQMGNSVDWSRERFTMDEQCSRAVTEAFVRLHEDGLIYRGSRLVNWDPVLRTAISDLEVESREEAGKLWHFRYPLVDGEAAGTDGHLVVATTRPETMLGDTAIAVNPEDERFRHLIGQRVRLPIVEREIPIIADDYVDPAFGSGCVKITPAHDFNDYAIGQRHNLPLINILTPDARINDNAPERYRGLDRFVAREKIIAEFESLGLLDKVEDHKLMVPHGDRTDAVVEPYLTEQWFVTMQPLADLALGAVADGRMRFVPENWVNTYHHWLHNIQDWCISRQLWWGHRIPAWYGPDNKVYVGRDEAEARARAGLADDVPLRQDEDVFDTWFSSALWPFSTLGWPDQTADLSRHYPGAVLVTGFDIIFFWVARMAMMGLHFMGEVPFRDVYITGLVRDPNGNKMSKSKGNVIDPLDLVEGITLEALVEKRTSGLMQPQKAREIAEQTRKMYPDGLQETGVDALRFTFAALASTGRDIRFDPKRAEGYRNFCNKIWNAARFVLMNCENEDCGTDANAAMTLSAADRWIISRLQKTEAEAAAHFANYRFDLLAQTLYQFVWNEYCDWYLELAKPALQSRDIAAQRGTRRTLVRVLETLLRLLHPLMPFITEDIWQRVAPLAGIELADGESIMRRPYPLADSSRIDEDAEADIEWLKAFIMGVRQIRGEMNLPPGKSLPVYIQAASKQDMERTRRMQPLLTFLARIEAPWFLEVDEAAPKAAVALLGEMKILVPMKDLIDKDAELARLGKLVAKLESDLAKGEAQLSNPNFTKAPEAVVNGARQRVARQREDLAALREQLATISAL
jgi:valyl-tRNA synthetase